MLNKTHNKKGTVPWKSKLHTGSYFDLAETIDVVTIDSDNDFQAHNSKYNLPVYSRSDARKSPYQLLPLKWTQKLGDEIIQSKVKACQLPSARSDEGRVVCFFPRKLASGEAVVINRENLILSAATSSGNKIRKRSNASDREIYVEMEDGSSYSVPVLQFPI